MLRFADHVPYTIGQIGRMGWGSVAQTGSTLAIGTDASRRWLKITKSTPSSVATANYAVSVATSGNICIAMADVLVSGIWDVTLGLLVVRLGSNAQVSVTLNSGGRNISVRTGAASGTALVTVNDALTFGVVNHICLVATIGDSGSYTLYVNGKQVATGSGDTQGHTSGGWDTLVLGTAGANGTQNTSRDVQWANIVLCDGSGSTFNAYPGVLRGHRMTLIADGFHQDGVPTGGGAHYTQVNDATPDDDTSTVTLSNVNDAETYEAAKPTAGIGDIGFLSLQVDAKTAGSRQLDARTRISSTNYDAGAAKALAGSYAYSSWYLEQNPQAVRAWERDDFGAGAAQIGVVVTT